MKSDQTEGGRKPFVTWVISNGMNEPKSNVVMMTALNLAGMTLSTNTIYTRIALQKGKAYHLNANWNGVTLKIVF